MGMILGSVSLALAIVAVLALVNLLVAVYAHRKGHSPAVCIGLFFCQHVPFAGRGLFACDVSEAVRDKKMSKMRRGYQKRGG